MGAHPTHAPRLSIALVLLLPAVVVATERGSAVAAPSPSTVRVASANVYEGSLVRHATDLQGASDRIAFARRTLGRPGRVPDVVLLQEVLGTAAEVARTLNRHPRAERTGSRYVVATATQHSYVTGGCDGVRTGSFSLLRSSAILVNRKTVKRIHERGSIRTWGRWFGEASSVTGRGGRGCTQHPWIRATVQQPDRTARTVRVVNVHLAPVGNVLKNRGAVTVRERVDALHRRTPGDAVVVAGDFNITRCARPPQEAERRTCTIRRGHRSLLDAGYVDAIRVKNLGGPGGVVGVARRIDFLYAKGEVRASWWDRCYLAYRVYRWTCSERRTVFSQETRFQRCQNRVMFHGTPGDGCGPAPFRRYYADHPVLLATVS